MPYPAENKACTVMIECVPRDCVKVDQEVS